MFYLPNAARLPKWFGERPGKKAGGPETPEGEEAEVKEEPLDDLLAPKDDFAEEVCV